MFFMLSHKDASLRGPALCDNPAETGFSHNNHLYFMHSVTAISIGSPGTSVKGLIHR